jgi:hypothetical protein
LAISSEEHELTDRSEAIAIGSGATEFQRRFRDVTRQGDLFGRTFRLQRVAVEEMLLENLRSDVGGDVQIAYANRNGLQRMQSVVPLSPGSPFPRITFLGQNLQDFGQVGSFFVGMPGLA